MLDEAILMSMLLFAAVPAQAQVSIGINLSTYPELVPVPGYPVYYAPRMESNYFFYDGMYWVYEGDGWYTSSWYNGPWQLVEPEFVPFYVLRVPVAYYRQPPAYFRDWRHDAPPRWGEHWGNEWSRRHDGWDHWNRNAMPAAPPLPLYQRQYTGDRYPRVEQQQSLQDRNYHYQPHDAAVRRQYQAQRPPDAVPPSRRESHGVVPERLPVPQGRLPLPPSAVIPAAPEKQMPQKAVRPAQQQHPQAGQVNTRQPAEEQKPRHQQPEHAGAHSEVRPRQQGGPQEPGRDKGSRREKDPGRGHDREEERR